MSVLYLILKVSDFGGGVGRYDTGVVGVVGGWTSKRMQVREPAVAQASPFINNMLVNGGSVAAEIVVVRELSLLIHM